jgi:hypothetical protein
MYSSNVVFKIARKLFKGHGETVKFVRDPLMGPFNDSLLPFQIFPWRAEPSGLRVPEPGPASQEREDREGLPYAIK